MNNPWCESCSSKNVCYTSINRPKCYTPITNSTKSDLIKRSDAIATIGVMYERCDTYDITDYRDLMLESVKILGSADRPSGEWVRDGHHIKCNLCGTYFCDTDREGDPYPQDFCPHCGARMKGANNGR